VSVWQIDLASVALKNHSDVGFNELGENGLTQVLRQRALGFRQLAGHG